MVPGAPVVSSQAPPEASARIAPKSTGLSRPVPLTFGQPLPRPVRASRPLLPLAIAVVAFLGAVQVISTQAQGDTPLEQQLSERIAAVTSTGGTIATSSGVYQLETSLPLEQPAMNVEAQDPSQVMTAPGSSATQPVATGPAAATTSAFEATATSPDAGLCPPSATGPYCLYVVQEGDTLWGIAELLGLSGNDYFSGAELLAMSNALNDAQNWVIVAGQELRVPNATGIIHTVAEAETLSLLAEKYGATTPDVILANPSLDPNNVITGSELLVPSPSLWPVSGPLTDDETAAEAEDADGSETAAQGEDEADEQAAAEGEEDAAGSSETTAEEGSPGEALPTGEGEGSGSGEEAAAGEEAESTAAESEDTEGEAEGAESEQAAEPESRPAPNANPSVPEIRDQFAAGYIEAGGPPQYLERILNNVIPCESGYNLRAYNPRGPFYGLMQFLPETWANTGGGEWADAYQQGANTARLLHLKAANPRSQWPGCWGA